MAAIGSKLRLRRDIRQNWEANDPVLLDGELAVVTGGQDILFKIGNGVSAFSQLPYVHENELETAELFASRISQGLNSSATGAYSIAGGMNSTAEGADSQAFGYQAAAVDGHSFVWNGDSSLAYRTENYESKGDGTFSVNPASGISGFYVGRRPLPSYFADARLLDPTKLVQNVMDLMPLSDQTDMNLDSVYCVLSSAAGSQHPHGHIYQLMKEGGEFVYRDITAKNDISVKLKDEELTIFDHIEDVWYSAQDEELGLTIKN